MSDKVYSRTPCFLVFGSQIFPPGPSQPHWFLSVLGHFNALLSSLICISIDKIALRSKWKHIEVFCSAVRCYRHLCYQLDHYIWVIDGYRDCLPVSRSPLFRRFWGLNFWFSSQNHIRETRGSDCIMFNPCLIIQSDPLCRGFWNIKFWPRKPRNTNRGTAK